MKKLSVEAGTDYCSPALMSRERLEMGGQGNIVNGHVALSLTATTHILLVLEPPRCLIEMVQ
jgi:hypothetical protein